ncbi:FliM/FliN family flagellar motor switch protein [Agarilytica rhodophyticola]|uniref:FliM/FliN family flagellar motor switch protein n=1 Tax=Agarilytica rhodophyticola TaxID=1737490 RepID=UPI000B34732F|nr:FliM/FliN family flagellar motor switch protein [Agarilytica rhodophyticola]
MISYSPIQVQDFPELNKPFLQKKISNDEFSLQKILRSGVQYHGEQNDEPISIKVTSNSVDTTPKFQGTSLSIDTDFGTVYLFDFDNFYQRLTGVKVIEDSRLRMGKVNMANVLLPDAIYDAFGWSIPNKPLSKIPADIATMSLKISMSGFTLPVKIAAETSVWINIFNNQHWKKNCFNESRVETLPILVNTLCGSTTMTAKTWRSLNEGDVFIISKPNFDMQGEGVVSLGGKSSMLVRWHEQENNTIVEFKRWLDNMGLDEFEQGHENDYADTESFDDNEEALDADEWPENDTLVTGVDSLQNNPNTDSGTTNNLSYFDELPLEFNVRLGSFALSYRDACNLSPGDLFKLDSPLKGQVEILCQNRVVACGDLVDIDGKLGVEIVRYWSMEQ